MNNLLEYILNFVCLDHGFSVPGVIAGGCDGNGISYKVTKTREGWVSISVTNGRITMSSSQPEDSNWTNDVNSMIQNVRSLDEKK